MENSKSIISWGQLFIIFGTVCLFLFAFTQMAKFDLPKDTTEEVKVLPVEGYVIQGGSITGFSGENGVLEIPTSYSLGESTTITGTVTFNDESDAWDFMNEYYTNGASGSYDFYSEIYTHEYPWVYEYSIEQPSFVAGSDYKITSINSRAFEDNKEITKVIIPSSIKTIGNFAFQDCSNLKEVVFSEGLETLGDSSFWGCGLEKVELPNSLVEIYHYAFFRCKSLKEVVIGEGLKDINNGTFNACESLTKVTIKSKNDIEGTSNEIYAIFSNCPNLKEIYVPADRLEYFKTTFPWSWYEDKYKTI